MAVTRAGRKTLCRVAVGVACHDCGGAGDVEEGALEGLPAACVPLRRRAGVICRGCAWNLGEQLRRGVFEDQFRLVFDGDELLPGCLPG